MIKFDFRAPVEGQCVGKQAFETRNEANKAVRNMNRMGKTQRAYLCPHCRKFHHGTDRTKSFRRNKDTW